MGLNQASIRCAIEGQRCQGASGQCLNEPVRTEDEGAIGRADAGLQWPHELGLSVDS